jgi:hypothetical protein
MGTGSFPGVKRPGRGANSPPPSSAEVQNEYSYNSTPPLGPWSPVIGRTLPYPRVFKLQNPKDLKFFVQYSSNKFHRESRLKNT